MVVIFSIYFDTISVQLTYFEAVYRYRFEKGARCIQVLCRVSLLFERQGAIPILTQPSLKPVILIPSIFIGLNKLPLYGHKVVIDFTLRL